MNRFYLFLCRGVMRYISKQNIDRLPRGIKKERKRGYLIHPVWPPLNCQEDSLPIIHVFFAGSTKPEKKSLLPIYSTCFELANSNLAVV